MPHEHQTDNSYFSILKSLKKENMQMKIRPVKKKRSELETLNEDHMKEAYKERLKYNLEHIVLGLSGF